MAKRINKTKQTKDSNEYKAELIIMGRKCVATGSTISDVLLGLKPQISKGKSILTISHDDKKKERVLMPSITYKLFNSTGLTRDITIKNVSLLFNGI